MKVKDLIGQRFGRLIVIKRVEDYVSPNGYKYTQWLCKCDCGNEKIVLSRYLVTGQTKSCGCLQSEKSKENVHKAHIASRKHFGCMYCGSDNHYAKGLCKNCYYKVRREMSK